MLIGGCVILALPHLFVGIRQRRGAHLVFALATFGVIGIAIGELVMMRSRSLDQFIRVRQWTYVPITALIIALVWFVRLYFRTGRLWLGLSVCALRVLTLIASFKSLPAITGIQSRRFLGEIVSAPIGQVTPWIRVSEFSSLLLLIYVIDASISSWRQGTSEGRRKAIIVGGSMTSFVLLASGVTALINRDIVSLPYLISFPFTGILMAMSFELGFNLFRAGQVAKDLERSQASLFESEERFRTMANAAPVMIWMSASDKLCTFFNKAWLEFTGRTMEQEWGNGWTEGVHPDDFGGCLKTYVEAFDAHEPFVMQYRLRNQKGEYRWVTDKGVPRFNRSGDFRGYIGACVDITDLLQQQNTLHEFEERVTLAAEAAHLGVWELDTRTNELWISDKARELFQFDRDARVTYQMMQERVHPEDRALRDSALNNAIKTHGGYEIEYRIIHSDGTVRWIGARTRCIADENGKLTRLLGVSMDVTERRGAQELFRIATEASINGIILVNDRGRVVLTNTHLEELFGYGRQELIGKPIEIFVPERFVKAHPTMWKKYFDAPERRMLGHGRELFGRRKDGTEFPVEIGLSPVQGPDGLLVLATVVDISERKRAEAEAQQRREEVVRLSRINLLGEMTATIAHELNQPLSGITSNSSAAQRFIDRGSVDLGEIREILVDIAADARRASDVIQRIRNTVKKGAAVRERIDLNEIVTKVAHMVAPDARLHSCELEMYLAKNLPPVEGDPVELQQVLINLTTNAFDAMKKVPAWNRKVEISTVINDGMVGLSVRDHGPGISEEARERMFEQFFTTKEDGLGMGLAIVRSIIESHGGKIAADNVDGGGARFYLNLPSKGV